MLLGLIGTVVSGLVGSLFSNNTAVEHVTKAAKTFFHEKQKQDKLKLEQKLRIESAKVDAQIKKLEQDTRLYGDADNASIEQWKHGYKDEILTYSLVVLVLACFVPGLQPYVREGIALLNSFPGWVQLIVGGAYISILGMRFLLLSPLKGIFSRPSRELDGRKTIKKK